MKYLIFVFGLFLFVSCTRHDNDSKVQSIVDKAIRIACNGNCDKAIVDFTFRDRCYVRTRKGANYTYQRITSDSSGVTIDIVSNTGFERYRNDTLLAIPDSMATKYSNSVNSVHYFSQLPYGLNDVAVNKELLGISEIKGKSYYKIQVTFSEENGGEDFEDIFIYWINKESFIVDYLAYSYKTSGGGIRFREAYNPRVIGGIRFVDYKNYEPLEPNADLYRIEMLFETKKLKLLSTIETEAIGVTLIP